jgi:AbrB family looped-hinge helix DNA binding protein
MLKYYFKIRITILTQAIVTVTKKGQATIPSQLRKKHKIGRKVLVIDTEAGVLLKPVADPIVEKGSLKELFAGTDSRDLIEEARFIEKRKEKASRHR